MFVHLHLHTPYSWLDGGSDIETLVRRAAQLGMPAMALTDHDSLTASVKFRETCAQYGVLPIFGTEITLADGSHLTLLAKSRAGYANICRMLTLAYEIGGRLSPSLPWERVAECAEGVICLSGCRQGRISRLLLAYRFEDALAFALTLKAWFGPDLYMELQDDLTPRSRSLCQNLAHLARHIDAKCVATNNVHFAEPQDVTIHDIKRCIAHGVTVADEHPARPLNAERHLKSGRDMATLFAWIPDAVINTMRIAEACASSDILASYEDITPPYPTPDGIAASEHLRELAYQGARRRRGRISRTGRARLEEELNLLNALGFAEYVLHAARIVRWARSQGIMVTGRGSGADSEICYTLGLTDVDVIARQLPVARWVAPGKRPDIDLDFDARRRDEVLRWVAADYGPANVALCCTYATYWARGAIRDIGKALALPEDALEWFRKHVSGFVGAHHIVEAFGKYAELKGHAPLAERFGLLFDLCNRIAAHPRHLGSHSSGLVISRLPLHQLNAVSPTARGVLNVVMLDKDDVETVGALKLDILSLPILSVAQDAAADIRRTDQAFDYEAIPLNDKGVYDMLATGSNMGAFQLGSPAQGNLGSLLGADDFEDLVRMIGLVRPGPIRSRSVSKYVEAHNGRRPIEFLHHALIPILGRTLGVVCFQEQVSHVIAAMMGMSDADADAWRKRLTRHSRMNTMDEARAEFVARALAFHRDLPTRNAHKIMDELQGWSGLGFTEGHAASFAWTAQKTAYMIRYYPAQYYAALASCQPCGFYEPQSLMAEARRRGVLIQPVDINHSELACTTDTENGEKIRLGFCLVRGLNQVDVERILQARENRPFASLLDFCIRVPLPRDVLEGLVLCGAFDALHEHRRGVTWRLDETIAKARSRRAEIADAPRRLDVRFAGEEATPISWEIADLSDWDKLNWEWRVTGVTSSCHPFAHIREALWAAGITPAHQAMCMENYSRVSVAGLNIRPHRPPSKQGGRHLFNTVEDESDYLQCAYYGEDVIDRCTPAVLLSPAIVVTGIIRRRGQGAAMEVEYAEPLNISRLIGATANKPQGVLSQPPHRSASAR